jgi:hypothetical protein
MATSLDLARTYTSYSGVDIRVIINGAQVGSMQALSYAIQREKAPIYVMGSVDPISYSRGKRGIAGTMISLMMDTHILMSKSFQGEKYLADTDEVFPGWVTAGTVTTGGTLNAGNVTGLNNADRITGGGVNTDVKLTTVGGAAYNRTLESNGQGGYQRARSETQQNLASLGTNYKVAPVFYVDQILPFDIAIVAANEYGQSAQMRLYGCEILNEGSGFSIDDIVIENQMTYVCRTILPWRSFQMAGDQREALYGSTTTSANDMRGGAAVTAPSP